ncbi:2-succinyl-6-hydroxy-2,4-cyclohexadiene-1-carboxylate synthase [[Pantoea] beijingensis]|uniref:2-succinyl-6-hydroxy-2,4-cyclohexadiene-1-carboxylate synthase n=1 Tax=[Pantoea] beijingensis TaxID=1324864 RepID=A0A443IB97_9GAMM|nr:2-succinyl-6-hydroxy-2,4-cyclohexadiene-1-carboxylate synthase [[Pantoea] beijingensis]RWR01313.1 2-succinyl-6-hydroxy-2,4-cyclohexadiene-1-carboxylate synthase [[Pantoea] beijingensis]
MMLHARWQGKRHSGKPTLIWLHGFLGNASDWDKVQRAFGDWPRLSIDLPGHGGSSGQRVSGFDELCQRINQTLMAHQISHYWLIGYSLGGRVAMHYACRNRADGLCGLIVEAGHTGLSDEMARHQRQRKDKEWAQRFRTQPLRQTLEAWYCQPIFAEMLPRERQQVIGDRAGGYAPALADMLEATSLSRQPDLLPELHQLRLPFSYLCGERDSQYQQFAREMALPLHTVTAAGHNAHRANPAAYAQLLTQIIGR